MDEKIILIIRYGHTSGVNHSKVQFKSIKSSNPYGKCAVQKTLFIKYEYYGWIN